MHFVSKLQMMEGDPEIRCPKKWKEAVKLVEFAVQVCKLQHELGGGFVFEHPQSASSLRKIPKLRELWGMEGVVEAIAHMCEFGMKATDAQGEGPVLKPTRFLTNIPAIAHALSRRCTGCERHVQLVGGKAKKAGIYPRQLVDAILDELERHSEESQGQLS